MAPNDEAAEMYTQLLTLSRDACTAGLYAAAFHALAAAMHCAADIGDAERLAEVEGVVQEELDWIDSHAPQHLLSMRSSVARSSPNLWASLAQEARTRRQMAEMLAKQRAGTLQCARDTD